MRPCVESVSSWFCRLQFWRCDRHRRKQGSRLVFQNQFRGIWVAKEARVNRTFPPSADDSQRQSNSFAVTLWNTVSWNILGHPAPSHSVPD
jgi:hypothetical protein